MNKRLRYHFIYRDREYSLSDLAELVNKSKYKVASELKKLGLIADTDVRKVQKIEIDRDTMIHLITNHRLKDNDRTNLCFDCGKACGKCSWSRDFTPVKGWVAKQTRDSYEIMSCPEFDLDDKPMISIDDFDDKGAKLLIRKIVASAIQDYRHAIRSNNQKLKNEVEKFFRDGELLSFTELCKCLGIRGLDVDQFLERISERPEIENYKSFFLSDYLLKQLKMEEAC